MNAKANMPGNMDEMLRKAQQVQRDIAKVRESLKDRVVEGKSGNGAVVVQMNGAREVVVLKIDPKSVDPSDISMLEDLVQVAVNHAIKKCEDMINKEMNKASGMNLGGLMG